MPRQSLDFRPISAGPWSRMLTNRMCTQTKAGFWLETKSGSNPPEDPPALDALKAISERLVLGGGEQSSAFMPGTGAKISARGIFWLWTVD